MKYKAVVFDLDGTLIDSMEDLGNAVNQSLKYYGFPSHDIEKYKYFIGNGAEMMVTQAIPEESRSNDTIKSCLNKFNEIYDKTFNVNTKLYNDIPELLNNLRDLGFKIAILTNKPYEFTMKYVDELLSLWNFDVVIGNQEGIPRKPDPAGAKIIINDLAIDSSQILYLGDSGVDMITAVKAGMFPVGVLWGLRSSDELLSNGAKFLISSPLELLNIINN